MTAFSGWVKIPGMNVDIPEHLQGPEWGRLPKPKSRLEGLSRTTCVELIDAELVESATIRKPGAQRGIRLIYLPGLRKYLHALASKQAREKALRKGTAGKRKPALSPERPRL
jgi:hypothetical protein